METKCRVLVNTDCSRTGAVIVLVGNKHLEAQCPDCHMCLGWTWKNSDSREGFWSCKWGCFKEFNNELGPRTSSYRSLDNTDGGRVSISDWVAGWIGLKRGDVAVEVKW